MIFLGSKRGFCIGQVNVGSPEFFWRPFGDIGPQQVAAVAKLRQRQRYLTTLPGQLRLPGDIFGDAFVTELNPTSSALVFSTFLGGSGTDGANAIAVGPAGNIYVTGPRGIWVISPQAEHLGVIRMPEHAGNLNWGGANWDELYCACSKSIYRVKLKVRGNPVAYMKMR